MGLIGRHGCSPTTQTVVLHAEICVVNVARTVEWGKPIVRAERKTIKCPVLRRFHA